MKKLGVAIIGCGDMGGKHAASWSARSDARVVAVCDHSPDRAAQMAAPYGASPCNHWHDAISLDGVDAVSICVPTCDHRDIAVAAAKAGRHVLCEKPMALTLAQADEMRAAAAAAKVNLLVSHQYRSLSIFRTIKTLIDSGRIGAPIYVRFTEMREVRPKLAMHRRSKNGGPVHDMAGHLFDMARFLTGAEGESVHATGAVFGKGKVRLREVADFGVDTAEIQARFSGGHCLSIGLNWGLPEGTPGHSTIFVHGPDGFMYVTDPDNPDRFIGDISGSLAVVVKDGGGTETVACGGDEDGPHACIEDLVQSIRTGRTSQFDAADGRAALAMIMAALDSVETSRTIRLAP